MIEWIILGTILFIIAEIIIIKYYRKNQSNFVEFFSINVLNIVWSFLISKLLLMGYNICKEYLITISYILLGVVVFVAIKYLIYKWLIK